MDKSTIVEVTSWDWSATPDSLFGVIADAGAGGVVIKASQGTEWTFAHLPVAIRTAKAAGLLVGVIHYAEPWANDPTMEAEHLTGSLPDDDLPLGLWLELDALGSVAAHEVGGWAETWLGAAILPKARPVLMAAPEVLLQMAGAPFGKRWVSTGKVDGSGPMPWAERVSAVTEGADPAPGEMTAYRLTSVRGLNAPEMVSAARQEARTVQERHTAIQAGHEAESTPTADELADAGLDAPEAAGD
jgi:hypothetical protein